MVYDEETVKVERVQGILKTLSDNWRKKFGEELEPDHLLAYVDMQVEKLKGEMIQEAIGHLFIKHSFDPQDLFRAKKLLQPKPMVTPGEPLLSPIPIELKAASVKRRKQSEPKPAA